LSAARLVSVIIPCRDGEATLGEQLSALADQRWSGEWEVVVADNGSRDGSRRVAESFASRLPALRVVDAGDRAGAAHARNRGAAAANGDLLLFCDADDVVGSGWLAAMVRALEDHPFVASRFEFARLNSGITRIAAHPQESGLNPYDYPPFLPHAGGSGLGVRREIHERVGGFDEDFPYLEDTDYCFRIQLAGVELYFVAEAVVHVRMRGDLRSAFRQMANSGKHNVQLYARYRDHGMPRLGALPGALRWGKLVATAPLLVTARGRRKWIPQLGWRLGRLSGCFAYGVLAP